MSPLPGNGMETAWPTEGQAEYVYAKDPGLITRIVLIGFVLCFAWSVLLLLSDGVQAALFYHAHLSRTAIANDVGRERIGERAMLGLSLAQAIFSLRWMYVMNSNCHGFGAEGMKFSPGWAAGWFFVPIANLIQPFNAMREIWRVSTNPADWRGIPTTPLLVAWWALWLGGAAVSVLSVWIWHGAGTREAVLRAGADAVVGARVLLTLALGAAFLLVRDIAARQFMLVSESGLEPVSVASV